MRIISGSWNKMTSLLKYHQSVISLQNYYSHPGWRSMEPCRCASDGGRHTHRWRWWCNDGGRYRSMTGRSGEWAKLESWVWRLNKKASIRQMSFNSLSPPRPSPHPHPYTYTHMGEVLQVVGKEMTTMTTTALRHTFYRQLHVYNHNHSDYYMIMSALRFNLLYDIQMYSTSSEIHATCMPGRNADTSD